MIDSLKTSNGVSHLAKQTTDMAPMTVETTIVPTAMSNIMRSNNIFVNNSFVDVKTEPLVFQVDYIVNCDRLNKGTY